MRTDSCGLSAITRHLKLLPILALLLTVCSCGGSSTTSVAPATLAAARCLSGLAALGYNQPLQNSGSSTVSYTWSVAAGALPPGLTLVSETSRAMLVGGPTMPGVFPFTLKVQDSSGQTNTMALSITVTPVGSIAAAGSGSAGSEGGGGTDSGSTNAESNSLFNVALDEAGTLYITDDDNRARKVESQAHIITTAIDKTAVAPNTPFGVALDAFGNLSIADGSRRVQQVAAQPLLITAVGGTESPCLFSGSSNSSSSTMVTDVTPRGVALDAAGNLYIVDPFSHRVLRVDGGTWSVGDLFLGNYTTTRLPASAAVNLTRTTNGTTTEGLSVDDISNWRCGEEQSRKLVVVTCPPYDAKGDGSTNDTAAFTSAVNATPTGGTLYVPPGTYNATVTLTKQLTLRGAGASSIITFTASLPSNILTVTSAARDVAITDLQIQGQAAVQSSLQRGIYLTGSSTRTTIRNIVFGGTTGANGVHIGIQADPTTDRNKILGNTLRQIIGTKPGSGYGMLIESSDYNVILGNNILFTASQGRHQIYLSAGSSYNTVTYNRLDGGTSDQITIYAIETQPACRYNVIQGNILRDMNGSNATAAAIGITQKAFYNVIEGNIIINPNKAGIRVEASQVRGESHADDNQVIGNHIQGAGMWGILISGSSRTLVQFNRFIESDASSAGSYATITMQPTGTQAVGNRVLGNVTFQGIDSGAPVPLEDPAVGSPLWPNIVQGGVTIKRQIEVAATISWGRTIANSCETSTSNVTGAAVGDLVQLAVPTAAVDASTTFIAFVSAADTVTVRRCNVSGVAIADPAALNHIILVTKFQ